LPRPWCGSQLALLSALAACASNPTQRPPDEIVRTFPVDVPPGLEVLEIRATNGRVTISDGPDRACAVSACVRGTSQLEAGRLAAALALDTEDSAGVRVVSLRGGGGLDMETVNLCVEVTAPRDLAVRILTCRAAVVVHGYRGSLRIDTDSGDVSARLAGGDADIRSRSGLVRLSGSFARAQVRSDAGAVQVVLPGGSPSVEVQTALGDVTLEVPQDCRLAFSARLRHTRSVPCEPAATWSSYGTDAGDRWRLYRGAIGVPAAAGESTVNVVSESGRIALRSLPGS
jgi:hypothetical protein